MAVFGLPTWLLAGLVLGAVSAVVIAGVFLAGEQLFPSPNDDSGSRKRGEEIRREEIGYYLEAIGEAFETDATVEGHDVAFFLPDRDVAVTFDARAYLSLQDSEVFAILVEHEMPGVHLGNRLPFDAPTIGPESDGDGGRDAAGRGPAFDGIGERRRDPHQDAGGRWAADGRDAGGTDEEQVGTSFAILGLPPDASREEVKSAYRARVKEVHPDHGGDEKSFKRIQDAYAMAKEHAD